MILDTALRELETAGRPVRVGMVGAGATGRAIALQLGTPVPGVRRVGIADRTAKHGEAIDVLLEVTGTVEPAARVVLDAFAHGKHVVLVNAELDSLLGPILKEKADKEGVVITHTDGDEPGVAMTLLRYLRTLGLRPVAAGNIKGMVDYYRTPDTQRAFAEKHDQDVKKVTSFADSTKLSMEATVLANATGFGVGRRGMFGPACGYVRDLAKLLPAEAMLSTGLVDYSVGAAPYTGAFVI